MASFRSAESCSLRLIDLALWIEQLFYRCGHFGRVRCNCRLEALNYLSVAIDQEFCEIPLDVPGNRGCRLFCQVFVKRSLVVSLDGDLSVHRESDAEFCRAECLNFRISTGFLRTEIVGWETYHHQTFVLVFLVQRF